MQKVLIIGATSAIAEATARRFAARGDRLHLMARDTERLATIARDLELRGADAVTTSGFDAEDFDGHPATLDAARNALDGMDVVLIAYGTLPDQPACERDFAVAHRELRINALGTLSLLTHLANTLEAQGSGTLAVITSVAGDRGRQSNYLYGAAKGMVSRFLQGLRNRLHRHGVQVVDIKPGFVDTPMTASFDKGALWSSPDQVAAGIVRAIERGRHSVYAPWFWRPIMLIIRSIPERLFVRLKL